MSASVWARTRAQSVCPEDLALLGEIFPVRVLLMFVCLADRNNVIVAAARGVHHKHHHVTPQPQRLQAQFTVSRALVFSGDGVARENDVDADEVESMHVQISQALGFIGGKNDFFVDSNKCKATTEKGHFSKQPPIEFDHLRKGWTAKASGLRILQHLLLRADEVIQ